MEEFFVIIFFFVDSLGSTNMLKIFALLVLIGCTLGAPKDDSPSPIIELENSVREFEDSSLALPEEDRSVLAAIGAIAVTAGGYCLYTASDAVKAEFDNCRDTNTHNGLLDNFGMGTCLWEVFEKYVLNIIKMSV